jgi:Sulfotransferase family
VFPDFLVIGAQKAGTTWLHRNLQTHPQIWMPKEKELHYFDEKLNQEGGFWARLRGDRIADARWRRQFQSRFKRFPKKLRWQDVAWDLRYFFKRPSDEWYASLFEQGKGKVTGEATPDYSVLDRDTIAHVYDLMPDAKIIFMMRSPIERPWSAMDMRLRSYGSSFDEVRDRKLYRQFGRRRMLLKTDYLRTLENWGSFYPAEQIFAGFLEDIRFFPEQMLGNLYRFLDVDASMASRGLRRKIHASSQSTMPTRFAVHLALACREDLERLAGRFGGYASFWLHCAEKLINDPPPEEHIPYPLWESKIWKEWEGSRDLAIQSGPLSSVGTAS